jgi:hypothetical protein
MLRKLVYTLAAVVLIIVGGVVVYFALSIPRDIRAEGLLAEARESLEKKDREAAREKLTMIVRDYPRTDAAAAATFALFRIDSAEKHDLDALRRKVTELEKSQASLSRELAASKTRVAELEKKAAAPPPAPPQAAPKPAVKKPPAKKPAPRRRTPPPRRRRRAELPALSDETMVSLHA